MSAEDPGPTLTDAAGMGGVIAQDGFDYQLWDGLARLPSWLANPTFEGLIFEGLEDLEARFFAPHVPLRRIVERYQGKSAQLSPKEVGDVFERFRAFETKHPSVARVQTLVTQRLPPTLQWVGRDAARVRKARPFYAPFPSVLRASTDKLRTDLIEQFGDQLGRFVDEYVEVAERVLPDRDAATNAFAVALDRAFPALGVGPRKTAAAFEALETLGRASIGKMLSRAQLVAAVESGVGTALMASAITIHVRSDRNDSKETALEIDASAFSGGDSTYPPPERWASDLVSPLRDTAAWLVQRGMSRIALAGSYRLSTAFAIGWALRSATGFELEIQTRAGAWVTDHRPTPQDPEPAMKRTEPGVLAAGRLAVAVGILRNPADDLIASGIDPDALLSLHSAEPIASGKAAQAVVSLIKAAVDSASKRLRPAAIDLYFAGPAALAVALGHRWNAMGPTQVHEYVQATRTYVPTAFLA